MPKKAPFLGIDRLCIMHNPVPCIIAIGLPPELRYCIGNSAPCRLAGIGLIIPGGAPPPPIYKLQLQDLTS